MAELFELSYCPSSHVPENKFSHRLKEHYGFVPKLSHHGGKTIALWAEKHMSS